MEPGFPRCTQNDTDPAIWYQIVSVSQLSSKKNVTLRLAMTARPVSQSKYQIRPRRLTQWDKRRSAEQEAVGSNPGWTNTEGLKITEEKVLSL